MMENIGSQQIPTAPPSTNSPQEGVTGILVRDLSKAFSGRTILDSINLAVSPGEICALIGPSSGGKSTLLKLIAGVYQPDCGDISPRFGSCEDMSLMFQEGALFDSLSMFDNIAFPLLEGCLPLAAHSREVREAVLEKVVAILARVGLTGAAQKLPGEVSGGMRRRASLARALVTRPRVLLLDDPTAGLDPVASSIIMSLIVELHREYCPATIIVSHDLRRLLPAADSVAALFGGRVTFRGQVAQMSKAEQGEELKFISCRYDLG